MLPYYFLVCVFMTFQKGRRRKSTRFGIWSTWLMFCNLSLKKDENSKKDGWCFPPGSLWDLDGPICRTWMLYAGSVLSFSVTIRIPPPCPSWGWAVIWWGCSPYPAHLPHPNKNIWLQWHQPHRAYEIFAADFTPVKFFASTDVIIQFRCLFLKLGLIGRIWSTSEAVATSPPLAFRETN